MPYVRNISQKLRKIFREHKYDVRYCRLKNDIYSKLYNHKDPIPNMHKSGVYRIGCQECPKFYIGETKRSFIVRKKEHIKHTKYKETEKSTLAEHQNNTNHNIDWDNGKVIKTSKNDFIRKLDEAIAIRSSDENLLLNKNCGEFMPYIWNKFILKR